MTSYIHAPGENFLGERDGWVPSIAEDRYRGPEPSEEEKAKIALARAKQADADAKAAARAIQQQGYQEYNQLLMSGARPEEALRRAAPKLFYQAPAELADAIKQTAPPPEIPKSLSGVPAIGADGKPFGHAIYNSRGDIHSFTPTRPDSMSPAAQLELKDANEQVADMRRQLTAARRQATSGVTERERQAGKAAAAQLEQQLETERNRRRSLVMPAAPPEDKAKGAPKDEPKEAPKSKPDAKANEVIRVVKGRRAIFNGDTKEFIRWAE